MTKRQLDETKFLVLPSQLVDKIKETSMKRGISPSGFATDVLEKALNIEELGASIGEAVDTWHMREIQQGAGVMGIPRSNIDYLLETFSSEFLKELEKVWYESGNWYGKYLSSKMNHNEIMEFIEKDLKTSWNLNEIEINIDDDMLLRFTSFSMSLELTNLLLAYISGLFDALGFKEIFRDTLRGMATVKYFKVNHTR